MSEQERSQQLGPFEEYRLVNPEQARAVINYKAYCVLLGFDHPRFFDIRIYNKLKKTLGITNQTRHQGNRLFDLEKRQKHQAATAFRIPGSTVEYASLASQEIPELKKELEDWKQTEPEEYEKARGLIEVIQAGGLDQLDQKELRRILRSSVFHFPGIALSYQIKRNEQMIEDYKKSQDQQRTPFISKSGTTAKQRYEEYLRKKQQGELEGK